jgi:hypothetical protein
VYGAAIAVIAVARTVSAVIEIASPHCSMERSVLNGRRLWDCTPSANTHAGTDIRPFARCGRPAPINSDAIPATKRPNAIHLGCIANLVGRPPHTLCYYGWRRSGAMSVPPTDGLTADRGTRPEHCRGRCPRPAGFCRLRIGALRSTFQTRRVKRRWLNQ